MRFTQQQITSAQKLKRLGLPWEPAVGNYVFDQHGICPRKSPFQPGVYFLLNFGCFMQHVGGEQRFRREMVWLPTFHDARHIFAVLDVPLSIFAERIREAMEVGRELDLLYEVIEQGLRQRAESALPTASDTAR